MVHAEFPRNATGPATLQEPLTEKGSRCSIAAVQRAGGLIESGPLLATVIADREEDTYEEIRLPHA